MFRIGVVTLFPEMFAAPLAVGLVGKARGRSFELELVDPRGFATDRHRSVDDTPYGGGAGMVMSAAVLAPAIAKVADLGPVVLLTPSGRPLRQRDLARWAAGPGLALVAGRYEGFDARIADLAAEEVSLGDFVLTGGELAALAIVDGVVRLLPGTLGNAASAEADSFSDGLLEHPHYTRPELHGGAPVPEVLLSGDHARIRRWRRREALVRTQARRPDLLAHARLDAADLEILGDPALPHPEVELVVPALDEAGLGRVVELCATYGLAAIHVVGAATALPACPYLRPPPSGSRKERARRLDDFARAVSGYEAARGRVQFHPSADAARAALRDGAPLVSVVGGLVEPPVETGLDPVPDRIALDLVGIGPPTHRLAVRPWRAARVQEPGLVAALALERLIGER